MQKSGDQTPKFQLRTKIQENSSFGIRNSGIPRELSLFIIIHRTGQPHNASRERNLKVHRRFLMHAFAVELIISISESLIRELLNS